MRRAAQPVDTPELFSWVADIRANAPPGTDPKRRRSLFREKDTRRLFGGRTRGFHGRGPGQRAGGPLNGGDPARCGTASLGRRRTRARHFVLRPRFKRAADRAAVVLIRPPGDHSDGRWLWALALVLFGWNSGCGVVPPPRSRRWPMPTPPEVRVTRLLHRVIQRLRWQAPHGPRASRRPQLWHHFITRQALPTAVVAALTAAVYWWFTRRTRATQPRWLKRACLIATTCSSPLRR